jgi:hypothetical protein
MSHAVYRAPIYASYRRLYRARIALFRGDDHAMRESRKEVQKQYRLHGEQPLLTTTTNATNASANESAAPSLVELLAMADEAADMLRNSIVQSKLNAQTGHYGAYSEI